LLPGVFLFSVAKIIGNDFSGRGLVVINGIVSASALIINIILNLLLIPRIGIKGAAIASTISYSLATIILLFLFRHYTNVPISRLLLPQKSDATNILKSLKKD